MNNDTSSPLSKDEEIFSGFQSQYFSFFGKDSKINGNLTLSGTTFISSEIEGDITMNKNSKLIIESLGVITGNINCNNLDIYGTFTGKIISTGHVTIYPSGKLFGEIKAPHIIVRPGAILNGKSDINGPEKIC